MSSEAASAARPSGVNPASRRDGVLTGCIPPRPRQRPVRILRARGRRGVTPRGVTADPAREPLPQASTPHSPKPPAKANKHAGSGPAGHPNTCECSPERAGPSSFGSVEGCRRSRLEGRGRIRSRHIRWPFLSAGAVAPHSRAATAAASRILILASCLVPAPPRATAGLSCASSSCVLDARGAFVELTPRPPRFLRVPVRADLSDRVIRTPSNRQSGVGTVQSADRARSTALMGWSPLPEAALECRSGEAKFHQPREATEMKITTVGIDLAKHVIQVHGVDRRPVPWGPAIAVKNWV